MSTNLLKKALVSCANNIRVIILDGGIKLSFQNYLFHIQFNIC